jgi:uncharacterized protein (DUF58 family)
VSPGAAAAFDPRSFASLPGLEWKARYVMEGFLSGLHGSPFQGPSVEFRDYRDYQPGDDLRRLDWRLYARTDRLCIRQFEQETNARCYVLCDTSGSMAYGGRRAWGPKVDAARVLGMALSWLMLRQNDAVGLIAIEPPANDATAGDQGPHIRFVRPSQKPQQAGVMLRELGSLSARGGPALAELLATAARIAYRRSLIVLLSDLLEPSLEVERGLRRLRFDGHECVCLQILDADELDFPFEDAAVFEDLETGTQRQVPGHRIRETYLTRFGAFLTEWRDVFVRLEVPHEIVRTDEDPGAALRRFLARREARS